MDSEIKVSVEETCKRGDGGEVQPEHKGGRENGKEEEEEVERETIEEEEKNKASPQEREEAQRTAEPQRNGEVASDVEPAKERAEEEDHASAVEVVVVVNGLQDEDETEDGAGGLHTKLPEATEEAITREPLAEADPTNQSPDGAQ